MREPSPCACLSLLGAKTRARARTTSHLNSSVTYSSLDGSQAATNSLYLLSFRRRSAGLFYLPDRVPLHPLFVDRPTSASASTFTRLVFGTRETDSGRFFFGIVSYCCGTTHISSSFASLTLVMISSHHLLHVSLVCIHHSQYLWAYRLTLEKISLASPNALEPAHTTFTHVRQVPRPCAFVVIIDHSLTASFICCLL
jgi:hypothetical protein